MLDLRKRDEIRCVVDPIIFTSRKWFLPAYPMIVAQMIVLSHMSQFTEFLLIQKELIYFVISYEEHL
jgi:hypothetical protein